MGAVGQCPTFSKDPIAMCCRDLMMNAERARPAPVRKRRPTTESSVADYDALTNFWPKQTRPANRESFGTGSESLNEKDLV